MGGNTLSAFNQLYFSISVSEKQTLNVLDSFPLQWILPIRHFLLGSKLQHNVYYCVQGVCRRSFRRTLRSELTRTFFRSAAGSLLRATTGQQERSSVCAIANQMTMAPL